MLCSFRLRLDMGEAQEFDNGGIHDYVSADRVVSVVEEGLEPASL